MVELISKRYGTAIYELAVESNKLKEIEEEIKVVLNILESEKEFTEILNHPKVVVEEKIKIVENIFSDKISDELLGLIIVTVTKGRQDFLTDIFKYCLNRIDEHNGILTAFISSATDLTDDQKDAIRAKLAKLTNKTINMNYTVDESLIGGLVIRIGDRIVDNSVKGKIRNMSKELYAV
jgi:F-type H+-transporting ATPase subunit delta